MKQMFTKKLVSIPQAVSTVATGQVNAGLPPAVHRFNTASGKYCCNLRDSYKCSVSLKRVSIPQAVSTVATTLNGTLIAVALWLPRFNTASGKYCCNSRRCGSDSTANWFQYRKR